MHDFKGLNAFLDHLATVNHDVAASDNPGELYQKFTVSSTNYDAVTGRKGVLALNKLKDI